MLKYLFAVLAGVVLFEFLLFAFAVPIVWSIAIICVFAGAILLFCAFWLLHKSSIQAVQSTAYRMTELHQGHTERLMDSSQGYWQADRQHERTLRALESGLSSEALNYLQNCADGGVRVIRQRNQDYILVPGGGLYSPEECDMTEEHVSELKRLTGR